jgi:hypothetical protein
MVRMKVTIERNGRSREVIGWRRWAIAIPAVAIVAPVLSTAVLFVFGLALTVGVILMVALPIALILAWVGWMLGLYEVRTSTD